MTCERVYGFLPCAEDLGGSLFLMLVYGYFLLQGANLLSEGSELLLEVLDPGIVGGLLLPVLGALPDALIIVISGTGQGSAEDLQKEIAVGMGTLAGSTVMLLTIAWGGSVLLGRCDLDANGVAINRQLTDKSSMTTTGVTSLRSVPFNAVIMVATSLLYLTIQVPAWLGNTHPHMPALFGAVCCFITLSAYCAYQVINPTVQKHKMKEARKRFMQDNALHGMNAFASSMFGSLVKPNGEVDRVALNSMFAHFDHDNSGTIDTAELQALLTGLNLVGSEDVGSMHEDVLDLMQEFDADKDGLIDKDEFYVCMQDWVTTRLKHIKHEVMARASQSPMELDAVQTALELPATRRITLIEVEEDAVVDDEDEDDESDDQMPMTPRQVVIKAVSLLVLGALICAAFSDPMVGAVAGFATATEIPTFFVAFVVTPLASNASELVSSLRFAMGKKKKNISLTFCQVYGAVTMNNCLCLGLFLGVVYSRGLEWNFSAEVLSTMIPTLIVGLVAYSGTTFKTWVAFPVLALYPAALLLVWVLQKFE